MLMFVLILPVGAAIPIMGTFESPELVDAQGDVAYYDHYVGPRPIESIDFLRGWIEYDETTDNVSFLFHFMDLSDWARSTTDSLECFLRAQFFIEETPADQLHLQWNRRENQAQISTETFIVRGTAQRQEIESSWTGEFSRPGNFTILLRRIDVASLGTHIGELYLECNHIQYVPTTDVGFGNTDVAGSTERFSLAELRPPGTDDTEAQPTAPGTTPAGDAPDKTPTLGIVAILVAIAAAASARRRD